MYGVYINVSFNGEKRRSQEWTSVVVKQSHSHGSSIHCTGSIMVAVLMGINGLEPHYVGKTFGMAVLASMAFMSLICFGEMLLNRVGSYVMLVFMVVQLGAAGGTYPLDMAPHFYTVLHKYMPFSYTVHAFRHTLSMDGQIGQDIAVFVGILVVSTLATIIFYRSE